MRRRLFHNILIPISARLKKNIKKKRATTKNLDTRDEHVETPEIKLADN